MLVEPIPGGRPLRLTLSAFLLAQALGAFVPGPLLWGVSHLAYAPLYVRLGIPLLGWAVLWTPLGRALGRAAPPLGRALLGRRPVAYGLLPVAGMGIFWLLRSRVHFLGDGWLLGELVARRMPFHGFDLLGYHLHARLFALFGMTGEAAAFRLFAVCSVAAGGLYLAACAWSARRIAADPAERLLLYGLLVFFAPVQMFMGYVEAYALLAVLLLIFLAAIVLHYRAGAPLWLPACAFGLALAAHLDALFLVPLAAGLVLAPPPGARLSPARRLLEVGGAALAGPALSGVVLLTGGYDAHWFSREFLEGESHALLAPLVKELLTARHWKDLANLLLLLAPVPLAMIAVRLPGALRATAPTGPHVERDLAERRLRGLLLAACLALVLLMAFVNMRLGVVRDWDLFAAPALVFPFAAFVLWRLPAVAGTAMDRAQAKGMPAKAHAGRERLDGAAPARPSLHAAALATALLLAAPWFWVNAGETRALDRFRDVIADLPPFPRAYAHEEIGKYYRKAGDLAAARLEYETCSAIHPTNPRFHALLGGLLYNDGQPQAALPEFLRVLDLDSTYVMALEMAARINAEAGRPADALPFARRLAGRKEESAQAAALHAAVAARLGLLPEAAAAYERACRIDPRNIDNRERLAGTLLIANEYARAEQAFRAVLAADPRRSTAAAGLVAAIWMPCRADPLARARAVESGRVQEALAILDRLIGDSPAAAAGSSGAAGVNASGASRGNALSEAAVTQLRDWRDRMRALIETQPPARSAAP